MKTDVRLPFPAFLTHASMASGDPGDGGGGGGGGGGGSPPSRPAAPPPPPAPTGPFDALSGENKTYYEAKQYKNVDDVFTALRHAESFVGMDKAQLLKLPADRSIDKMGEVFQALGKPKDLAGYEFKENPEIGLAGPAFEGFQKAADKYHLTKDQAHGLIEEFYKPLAASLGEKSVAEKQASLEAGEKAARELFGAGADVAVEDIPEIKAINALLEEYGDEKLDEYLFKSGRGNDPALMSFLSKIAKLVGEPNTLPGERGRDTKIGGELTPAEASLKLAEFDRVNNDALMRKSHPDHAALLVERERLIKAANPPKRS